MAVEANKGALRRFLDNVVHGRAFRAPALSVALVTIALLAASVPAAAAPAPGTPGFENPRTSHTATLLYFNDAHEIGPVLTGGQDRGGVARLATAVYTVRAENPATSVILGGDIGGGTLFGGLYYGFPMVEAFNIIGIDLATFGNHDFDFGVDNTRALVAASDFPWITSNLVDAEGQPFIEGGTWKVQRIGKYRVGFIGLTDAIDTTMASDDLNEVDPIEAARAAIDDMTARANVDVIVAVAQYPMADGRALVQAVPEIDAVFLEEMAEYQSFIEYEGDAPLMASEGNMGSMIRLDIVKQRGDFVLTPSVIEVDDTVAPDPELRALEEYYAADMEANLSTVLATVATPLLLAGSRYQETALGDFVADAYRTYHGTQIGWMNGGGLRTSALGPDFTKRDAYAIVPFDNKVMAVEVSGAGIVQALEQAVSRVATSGGGFPQVSGMSYAYSPTAPIGARVSDVRVAGVPIDLAGTYTVAVTNYVFNGGDGVTGFAGGNVLVPATHAPRDAETVVSYATALGVIDVTTEGRITVLP